jgi:hypothetical protein
LQQERRQQKTLKKTTIEINIATDMPIMGRGIKKI